MAFAHNDNFANGSNQASLKTGRFSTRLEQDIKNNIQVDDNAILLHPMKTRLLNETPEYVSVNTRQIELYKYMLEKVRSLEDLLQSKCGENE